MNGPIDTGGFVYPVYIDEEQPNKHVVDFGITRRDWLAGLAMEGLISGSHSDKDSMHPTTALEIARAAYHVADLMISMSKQAEMARATAKRSVL
jgi:hypothetical protein